MHKERDKNIQKQKGDQVKKMGNWEERPRGDRGRV